MFRRELLQERDIFQQTGLRYRYSAGVQVPAGAHVVLDSYFLRQNQSGQHQRM